MKLRFLFRSGLRFVLCFCVLPLALSSARAQRTGGSTATAASDALFHVKGLPLKEALQLVCDTYGIRLKLAPEIVEEVNSAIVSRDISRLGNEYVESLLSAVQLPIPITYEYTGSSYFFKPDELELIRRKTYTLAFKYESLDVALTRIFDETKKSYLFVLPANTQRVTLSLHWRPFEDAINDIQKAARVSKPWQPIIDSPVIHAPRTDMPSTNQEVDTSNVRVTMRLKEANLAYALKALLTPLNKNYTVEPELLKYRVTLTLTNVPFQTALEALLKGDKNRPHCIYRIESGVYNFSYYFSPQYTNPLPRP